MAEAYLYADVNTKSDIKNIMERCINGDDLPPSWRESIIHPIHKKGPTIVAANYRGIAIGNSIYKLYASILRSRLEDYVEYEEILPDTQNGFRVLRSAIDNIYILNFAAQMALKRKKQLYVAYIDYKAAFDKVNRKKLFKKLRDVGVPEYIVVAIENIYRSTPYTSGDLTFDSDVGLKQGCPLSPLLFAIYLSDLDQSFRNQTCGGIVIGKIKIYLLAYADDIVLLADRPSELAEMLRVLQRYCERKDMVINVDKSKVQRFCNGGKMSKIRWKYGATELEEVNSFKYLGFTFQTNGYFTKHIKEMAKNGNRRQCEVWSLGQRLFANNFHIRKQMFKSLVEPAFLYGCEVTGFNDFEELERVQRKYYRWTLGLGKHTKVSMLMDEIKMYSMVDVTGKRAMQYEERAAKSPCRILRECVRLIHEGEMNQFTEGRRLFCERGGLSANAVSLAIREGGKVACELQLRQREAEDQLRELQLRGSRYAQIRTDHLPRYLQLGHDIRLIARFRLENEERGRQDWRADQKCRTCGRPNETLEHVLTTCVKTKGGVKWLLHETGRVKEMKEILGKREIFLST